MKRMVGRWIVMAVAVPLIAALLGVVADKVEQHRGPDSSVAKGLRAGRGFLKGGG